MLTIAIQAGGESSRMGKDKGLIPFLGEPLVLRVLNRVRPIAEEVLVTTNHTTDYSFLRVALFEDIYPGHGALNGFFTALNAASGSLVAVIACDMPFVNPELLAAGRDFLLQSDHDAVIPRSKNGLEPFHAVYRRETCLPAVKTALEAGQWRLISWLDRVNVHEQLPEDVRRYDPEGLAFWNLNTPEDFRQAELFAAKVGN